MSNGVARAAHSTLTLDVTNYNTLYIGPYSNMYYTSYGSSYHNEYATLTVTIDGSPVSISSSGTSIDVSSATTAVFTLNLKNFNCGSMFSVKGNVTISKIELS